jgi:hypothetical protein
MGDAEFSPRNNIQSQSFILKYESYSSIQEGFGGINDQGIGIPSGELILEFTTSLAKGEFIEEIERGAEFVSQVNNIAAADAQMALLA